MFVDELPDMPRIIGFDMVSGEPKSKSLKIGMFKKKWVSFSLYFLFLSPVLLKPYIIFGKLVFFSCSLGFRQFFIFYFLYDRIWNLYFHFILISADRLIDWIFFFFFFEVVTYRFYQLTLMFKTVFHVLDFDWFLASWKFMLSLLTLFSFLIELCEATEVVTVAHILPVLGFEH